MRTTTNARRIALLVAAASLSLIPACEADKDNNPLGDLGDDIAEQCGLTCPAEGIVEGNASISGDAKVDAFFGAVVKFNATANGCASRIETALGRIRASLDLDANADGAAIVAAIEAKYQLEGGIKIEAQPARCAVSAEASVRASARCEGQVDPGMVAVACNGSCEVEASGSVECSGELECTGTAPNLECEGTCQGSCELTVAAACTGTCRGTCEGNCSAENAAGQCAGSCDGECQGTCELTAGGECSGECRGQCTYTPPNAECNGTARCKAMGSASVMCEGRCEGEVTPPSASVECEASAKAEASLEVECTPPSIDVSYQFSASASAETKAEFQAFLVGFRANMSAVLAELKRADVVVKAGTEIASTGSVAVKTAVNASLSGDASLKAQIGLGCALLELDEVGAAIKSSSDRLKGQVTVAGDLSTKLASG